MCFVYLAINPINIIRRTIDKTKNITKVPCHPKYLDERFKCKLLEEGEVIVSVVLSLVVSVPEVDNVAEIEVAVPGSVVSVPVVSVPVAVPVSVVSVPTTGAAVVTGSGAAVVALTFSFGPCLSLNCN